jgi:threonine dehydrogenase-like Zn-dependent dehydrogenase
VRREYAASHGADEAFDPAACDAAIEIKLATEKRGADVAIETSGSSAALHQAVRCVVQCGTIVHLAFCQSEAHSLHLGEEWHLNRPTLIGSQAVHGNPDRTHPAWTEARSRKAVIELFKERKITGKGMLMPVFPLKDALEAIRMIDEEPKKTIKVAIRYQ